MILRQLFMEILGWWRVQNLICCCFCRLFVCLPCSLTFLSRYNSSSLPQDEVLVIIHDVFLHCCRLDNLIFDEKKPEVIAILDWELSTLGDPLSDLAYNCLPHHLPPNFPVLKGKNCVSLMHTMEQKLKVHYVEVSLL